MSKPAADPQHGSASTYNNYGCRCDPCRAAASAARASWVSTLQDRPFSDVPHGTPSGYRNWGCRCGQCTASRKAEARHRARALRWQQDQQQDQQQEEAAS